MLHIGKSLTLFRSLTDDIFSDELTSEFILFGHSVKPGNDLGNVIDDVMTASVADIQSEEQ